MWRRTWWMGTILLIAACGGSGGEDAHLERMAEEHADDAPVASPATAEDPAADVAGDEVAYATVDGVEVKGYLARPAAAVAGGPAMLVIHEWWGLNDNIRAMARKLAAEGYLALAVDLYGGRAADDPETARALATEARDHPEAARENLRQAYRYLESEQGAGRIGSIGWCFGGGWSLRTALMLPRELDAAVIYYGRLETDREQLATLEMPILGIFGALDQGIPVEQVRAFEEALGELGKDATIHVYEGADHAFANPSGTRYNAEAAADAWVKTIAFLDRHLKV